VGITTKPYSDPGEQSQPASLSGAEPASGSTRSVEPLSALAGEGLIDKTRGALILLQSHVPEERLVETT
jgi:hypothetical protein